VGRRLPEDLPGEPVSHNPAIRKRVFLRLGEVPHVTQYSRSVFQPGQVAPRHAHPDMYEAFVCLDGAGVIQIDGEPFALVPGTFLLVEPGAAHEIANTGPGPLVLHQLGILAPAIATSAEGSLLTTA
jgi:quercetin dioxygenase-like cupin family protein